MHHVMHLQKLYTVRLYRVIIVILNYRVPGDVTFGISCNIESHDVTGLFTCDKDCLVISHEVILVINSA